MRPEDILVPTPAGVCCKLGGFHIDPTRPVERALITHGHSDHARAGHGAVLATQETLDMMRLRYGENFAGKTQAARYGERIDLGGVTVTFHPAGHVLGSAQIAVAANGLRVVASGDYKNVADPTCSPFELIQCDARWRDRKDAALGRVVPGARAPRRRLFARQGAARHRAHPQGRLRRADLSARRDGEDHELLCRPRHRAR
jgi:glyoxylase-like metal-dependent hydrolase (beta-lactamase superfamily II)